MKSQKRDRIAQSIVNGIALLMMLGGIYLIFFQSEPYIGGANVVLGASLFSTERWRRER